MPVATISLKGMSNSIMKKPVAERYKQPFAKAKTDDEVLKYALHCYASVIKPDQTITLKQWAILIAEAYNMDEPKTRAVVATIRKYDGSVDMSALGRTRIRYKAIVKISKQFRNSRIRNN